MRGGWLNAMSTSGRICKNRLRKGNDINMICVSVIVIAEEMVFLAAQSLLLSLSINWSAFYCYFIDILMDRVEIIIIFT